MKAAIYCRLSEEDRNKTLKTEDSESIQNQKSMLLQYAIEQGWDIYKIYSDDDYTGSDRKRPEFNHLLSDAAAHKFDIVLCKTQSRFTRELELVEKYLHGLFPEWGIRFVSIVDNADTANKGNKKSRQINGLVNEWYLEDMSENIRSVLNNKRENGLHIGACALYGYRKDPEKKGHLIIDKEAAEIVHEIFTLFSEGYGKTAIARLLNERGIPNPTEYKRLHGINYKLPENKYGTLWSYSTIAGILKNEIYAGNMVQGKYGSISYKTKKNRPRPKEQWYRVSGTHEPIIGEELWEQVQILLNRRTKPFLTGKTGLFAGIAKCQNCGYTMRSSKNRGIYYLQCPNRHISKEACSGAFLSVKNLEQAVREELLRLTDEFLDWNLLKKSICWSRDAANTRDKLKKQATLYSKKITEYTNAIRNLYLDKANGRIPDDIYTEFAMEFTAKKRLLSQRLKETEGQLGKMEARQTQETARKDNPTEQEILLKQYLSLQQLDRPTFERMVNSVVIGKRIPGTDLVPIEIHWNF